MLRSVNDIRNYSIEAKDGEIGRVSDFYFDDSHWTIRYAVVTTGSWFSEVQREVLISPISLGQPDWKSKVIPVELTRQQVKDSPEATSEQPVSRQYEEQLARYYSWPTYWIATHLSTPSALGPPSIPSSPLPRQPKGPVATTGDPTLRSVVEVCRYSISARDGDIGHVEDFIAEDENWSLRYMVVDTRDWLPGKKVLIAPNWISDVDWTRRQVKLDLTKREVEKSPEYDPKAPVNRNYEERLYDYYGRPHYW